MEQNSLFTPISSVSSNRIIYTPSTFARSSLIHLQETGTLQALYSHKSERLDLSSCLFLQFYLAVANLSTRVLHIVYPPEIVCLLTVVRTMPTAHTMISGHCSGVISTAPT